jgi:hypothetical protein
MRRGRTIGEEQVNECELFMVREAEIFHSRSLNGYVINYPSFTASWMEGIYEYLTAMKEDRRREAH